MRKPGAIQNTNNYLIPDGSDRCIHDLQDKTFHTGILENGNNAYLVELPDLKSLLCTSRYLIDEVTGQFYVIYGNSYQHISTIPRLFHTWEPGQLIDELAATRHAFGYMELTGPAPAPQPKKPPPTGPVSTAYNEDTESLQAVFKKAMNFKPCILTKQTINTRRMNQVNQIDATQCDDEFEVNQAHT